MATATAAVRTCAGLNCDQPTKPGLRYCSRRCANRAKVADNPEHVRRQAAMQEVRTCARPDCGKPFTPARTNPDQRYCSRDCANLRGGVTPTTRRQGKAYLAQRQAEREQRQAQAQRPAQAEPARIAIAYALPDGSIEFAPAFEQALLRKVREFALAFAASSR